MRYLALATDYDGTLAHDGAVDQATLRALERLLATGRKLIMVTGREVADLEQLFPRIDLCERVVAENGAVLYTPATRQTRILCERPPQEFVAQLERRKVAPLYLGQVIVATRVPHEKDVIELIREMGLELQIIFNKGAVMILPTGVNKATGLVAALDEIGLSPANVVGVGDAENDHAFLHLCGCGVAVGNALESLKQEADFVTAGARGAGVAELIGALDRDDLASIRPRPRTA